MLLLMVLVPLLFGGEHGGAGADAGGGGEAKSCATHCAEQAWGTFRGELAVLATHLSVRSGTSLSTSHKAHLFRFSV